MRILVVNQYFHPDRSATAQLLTQLCEDLAVHHEVHVVTGRPSYNPAQGGGSRGGPDVSGPYTVHRVWSTTFPRFRMAGRLSNYATYLSGSVAASLAAAKPDVVLAWTDPPLIGLVAALAARMRGAPLVLTTQDLFPEVAIGLGRLSNPAAVHLLRTSTGAALRAAHRVVSVGRDMARRLAQRGVPAAKIRQITNWYDGRAVRPLASPSRLRQSWGLGNRFVVMHSGNVGLSQGLETLIEAADLLREHQDVRIAVVGDGASRPALERQVAMRRLSNVVFLDYQPAESLSESLGVADIHLVSLRRGLAGCIVPSKVYAIMAAGKPFIAAVEEGAEPALIAAEHRCGIHVPPADSGALADAILASRSAALAVMGGRARDAFEHHYDRRLATAAYRELLEEVAA